MKRTMLVGLATFLALAVSMPALAETDTSFGFQVGAGKATPPPRATAAPRTETRPGAGGMLFNDALGYTMFRYSSWYYVSRDGDWYRSHGPGGPFRGVEPTLTPQQVSDVPAARGHRRPLGVSPADQIRSPTAETPRGHVVTRTEAQGAGEHR